MRLTPTHAVAFLALFVALGGGAYAGTKLAKNSVGREQIRSNAVTSKKVKNGSLRAKDFKKGQLPAGPAGAQGPAGVQGPSGARGPAGSDGVAGPTGARGPTGPSAAAVAAFSTGDASPTLCCFGTTAMSLPEGGRVLVQTAVQRIAHVCSAAGSCSLQVAAYARAGAGAPIPVPGAAYTLSDSASVRNELFTTVSGIITLAPGDYTFGIGFTSGPNTSSAGGGTSQTTVQLVGPAATAPRPSGGKPSGRTPLVD